MYSGRRRSGVRDDAVRDGRVRDDVERLGGLARLGEGHVRVAALPAGDDLDGERLAGLGRVLLAGARRRDHAVRAKANRHFVGQQRESAISSISTGSYASPHETETSVRNHSTPAAWSSTRAPRGDADTLAAAQLATPHAEAAFVHAFCRDRSLLLGVEGYALTSLEVALATPPRPGDAVPVAPVPAPPTAVAA